MRLLRLVISLLLLTPAVPAAAQTAPSGKLDLALRAASQSGVKTHRVIIRVTPGAHVWGHSHDDNIVGGNGAALGNVTQTAGGAARQRRVVR